MIQISIWYMIWKRPKIDNKIWIILVYVQYTKILVYTLLEGYFVIPPVCSIPEATRNE